MGVIYDLVEKRTAEELKRKMRGEEDVEGENNNVVQGEGSEEEALGKSFSSIEYSCQEVPNIIPKNSEMLPRRSVCLSEEESKKITGGIQRSRSSSERLSKHSLESRFESSDGAGNENESDDEFYDCKEKTNWGNDELVVEIEINQFRLKEPGIFAQFLNPP